MVNKRIGEENDNGIFKFDDLDYICAGEDG